MDNYANFAYSTVLTPPSPATTGDTLSVQASNGGLFPAAPFNATVWPASVQPTLANAEIVRVTIKATDTFTITRAQEGTAARSIAAGYQIAAGMTKKFIDDMVALFGTGPPTEVTTLPGSPAAGQQAILVDSVTGPTYTWPFRYNGSSGAIYKWESIGPVPAVVEATPNISPTAALTYQTTTTLGVGPQFTLPRAGWYLVEATAVFTVPATASALLVPNVSASGGTGSILGSVAIFTNQGSTTCYVTLTMSKLLLATAANWIANFAIQSSSTSTVYVGGTLRVTPTRVS
jgi:hypothetical protein